MDLRIFTEPQQGATYDDQLTVAKATEDLGFDAFFRSDHYLAMGVDGLPGPSDAWITLGALARETSRIRLGTLVSPATFRLPGPLAISVAQVDAMSGGRVELGLGAGWYGAEHSAYGIPFPDTAERFARFAEQVEIVDGLLTHAAPATRTASAASTTQLDRLAGAAEAGAEPATADDPRRRREEARRRSRRALRRRVQRRVPLGRRDRRDPRPGARRRAAGRPHARPLGRPGAVRGTGRGRDRRSRSAHRPRRRDLRSDGLAGTPARVVERIGELAAVGVTRLYLQVLDLSDLDHLELVAAEVAPQL